MKNISIIIPAYNEESFISILLNSIEKVQYPKSCYEVLVVNDGSVDNTAEVVQRYKNVRLINLPDNLGRYECRKKGAQEARYTNLLFIDAHSITDPEILLKLDGIDARVINGRVLSVEKPGAFETFYNSIRRFMFRKYYKNGIKPFYLTVDNFDSMPKGTGVLYIEKEVLFSAYENLAHIDMKTDTSDDTKLLRAIVAKEPILNHPEIKITYLSRQSFSASIKHLYQRGPKFVDYYLNPYLRNFWLVIVFPLLVMASILIGFFFLPFSILIKITALLSLDLVISLILSKSIREIILIFFLMPLCIMVFYAGIIRGIYLKLSLQL